MNIKIFYFSGTGNSLVVARNIASKLKADLVSIPKAMKEDNLKIDSDIIGIVFPSYFAQISGLPLIVERFIKKIENIKLLRIFAVCTCGGYECVNALPSLARLDKIIRSCGGKLSAQYSTRLPMNNLDYHIPIPINKDQDIIIRNSKIKVENICDRIIANKGTRYRFSKSLFNLLMIPLFKMMYPVVVNVIRQKAKEPAGRQFKYLELMPLTDKSITVNNRCNGCGTCVKICPVNNIRIIDKKLEFQHRCEICFACDEWCPSGAITHWSRMNGVKYHHPEVKISDMLM